MPHTVPMISGLMSSPPGMRLEPRRSGTAVVGSTKGPAVAPRPRGFGPTHGTGARRQRPWGIATAAVVVLALCAGARGETGDYDLGEIVVTARKPLVEESGTVREVDRTQIDDSGARTLDEAIDLLPGVNVRVGGVGTPRIDVRGFRTRHVKLLLNGIPFNSAADGQFDPTLLPTEWISRIKLTSGASSQLYGDGGLGGVINVITRRGEGPPTAETDFEWGDFSHQRYTANFAYGNNRFDVFGTLGRLTRDGFDLSGNFAAAPYEDGGQRLNSDLVRNNAYLAASYRPTDAWEFGASLQYTDGEHGIPTGIYDNQVDPFAQRPRFDRVDDEDSYYLQLSAVFSPNEHWSNNAWVYQSVGKTDLNRYADDTFTPTTDPSVRNTFSDETRTRITGLHDHLEYTHPWGGTLTLVVEGRQEHLDSECVIQDVPLAVPPPPTPPPPPPPSPPTSLILDYTYTTTNNHGATSAAGGNPAIARLVATNRPGGGVDFSITNLAANTYGGGSFLQSVLLNPVAGFDPTGLAYSQVAGSQGEIGNVNFFTQLLDADGYLYPILVNFRRPGQGDPLLAGETASWIFNKGTVSDFFGQPTNESSPRTPDMYSGIRIRGTDANGFWGASGVDVTGGGPLNRVFVQAPATVDPNAPPPPPLIPPPDYSGLLLQDRVCGGGAGGGDGSGGGDGDGTGGNRVERLPGFLFGTRLIKRKTSVEVASTGLEFSVEPLPRLGLVAGVGQHWQSDDSGNIKSDTSYNFGATVRATQDLRFKGSIARKVRPPSIAQLYDPASGNTDLAFEVADLYEIGLRHVLPFETNYELTFFHEDVADLIQRDVVTGIFSNIAETKFNGLEFTTSTTIVPRLRVDLSYTHLTSRDESPGTERKQQQYTPENRVAVTGDYRIAERVGVYVAFQHVADQVYYSRGTPLMRRELDDYSLVDMNLHYDLPGKRASLYVGVDNLFDTDYAESYGLPQAGRFIYGGLKIKLL
jgi:outer membrane cobalamin receptor